MHEGKGASMLLEYARAEVGFVVLSPGEWGGSRACVSSCLDMEGSVLDMYYWVCVGGIATGVSNTSCGVAYLVYFSNGGNPRTEWEGW